MPRSETGRPALDASRGTANRLRRAAHVVLAMLLFVTTLEVLARIDDGVTWGAPLLGPYSRAQLTVTDVSGTRGRPYARFEKWRLNNFGFRGPDIRTEKDADVARLVIVGASEAFGLYEGPDREFPAELQRQFDLAAPQQYQIINAAITGMSPPRVIPYFDGWLGQFKPDIVLYYPTPHFYLDEPAPRFRASKPDQPARESLRLATRFRNLYKRLVPPRLQFMVNQWRIDRQIAANPRGWEWTDVPADRVTLFESHLTAIADAMQARGVRLILATHATMLSTDHTDADLQELTALRVFYPRASERALRMVDERLNEVVRRVASTHNLVLIDVSRRLPKRTEYFADFSHFTDAGAAAVAAIVRDEVLQSIQNTQPPGSKSATRPGVN